MSRISVIGAGTMGVGVIHAFATKRWETTVVEPNLDRISEMYRQVGAAAEIGVQKGKLAASDAAVLSSVIRHVRDVTEIEAGEDLVVECVPEALSLKQTVLAKAERAHPRVLATNTSALSIDLLANSLERPESFLGMHFFNPVWSSRFVEIVRGKATSRLALQLVEEAASSIGKMTAVVKDFPGFATTRLDVATSLEAMRMVQDGVGRPEDIDRAVQLAYGHPVGPLRLADIVGLDVRLDIARGLSSSLSDRFTPPELLIDMVARGDLGVKTGKGFYEWAT